jgi:hypothetical protein
MEKKKIILTRRQIELIAENELERMKGDDGDDTKDMVTPHIEKMIGDDPTDREIEYPSAGDIEAIKTGQTNDDSEGGEEEIDPLDMDSPPEELLEYLDKIEEAKSILSRVAAKESNDNIKNRIYSHYEKAQKLAFELIKEFGIVH